MQLCDFGVAGMMESRRDKRSTIVGTPHWMAPELFESTATYGKEIDVWGFGAMIYEIATGFPPLVAEGVLHHDAIGPALKQGPPKLEGVDYSTELCDLVAYCLQEKPTARPTIEQLQRHPYIYNTSSRYPTGSLTQLVIAFKLWEDRGGSRKSLFMSGGAQGPTQIPSTAMSNDEWNFHTTADFDDKVRGKSTVDQFYDAYGTGVELSGDFEETARPATTPKRGRRRPPQALTPNRANPLEKVFDPNTLSNYNDNSEARYRVNSDLPLRDFDQQAIRDTTVDVRGRNMDSGGEDMDTMRAGRRGRDNSHSEDDDFSRPLHSDPADSNKNRNTQDWKFPSMVPPTSADPEVPRFPPTYDVPRPEVTPGSGGRPTLVHHPTEPLGSAFGGGLASSARDTRMSMRESLIDLDLSVPEPPPPSLISRPSTSHSDVGSVASSIASESDYSSTGDAFELERHASLARPSRHAQSGSSVTNGTPDLSDASDVEPKPRYEPSSDSEHNPVVPPRTSSQYSVIGLNGEEYTMDHFPDYPYPPSRGVLAGSSSQAQTVQEMTRILDGFTGHLSSFRDIYQAVPQQQQNSRRDRRDG